MDQLAIHIPARTAESSSSSSSSDASAVDSPRAPTPKPVRELAPFLRLLREMLERESPAILRWTPDGRAFEILDLHQMTHVVLPKYFKHSKYASFQRQLNYFSFRKWTKSKSPRCTFANPHFVREAPELTWHITRKRDASRRRQALQRRRAQSFDPTTPSVAAPRDRAASEGDPEPAEDPLLQWIDDQFPSLASLALLDGTAAVAPEPPVWTAYAADRAVE